MNHKEQNINIWGFKDILMTIGYLSSWMLVLIGISRLWCLDANEFLFPISLQILFTFMLLAVVYYFAIIKNKNLLSNFLGLHLNKKQVIFASSLGFLSLIASTTLINIGAETITNQPTNIYAGIELNSLLIFSTCAVLVAPLNEEIFFRGFLQPVAVKRFGAIIGIIFTSLIFALAHFQYTEHIGSLFGIISIGIILGLLREKTSSLLPGIFAHLFNNIVAIIYIFGQNF